MQVSDIVNEAIQALWSWRTPPDSAHIALLLSHTVSEDVVGRLDFGAARWQPDHMTVEFAQLQSNGLVGSCAVLAYISWLQIFVIIVIFA